MDDLLTAFKEARRRQNELYVRLGMWVKKHDDQGEMFPEWQELALATQAFHQTAERFADYLLGVDT